MSNKHQTGKYSTLLFDKHGTLKETISGQENYRLADQKGRDQTKAPPYASYVVTRVITNSLDRSYPWADPTDTEGE